MSDKSGKIGNKCWSGSVGGYIPVQGQGFIDGFPWYFRARGRKWSLSICDKVDGDPIDVLMNQASGFNYLQEIFGESDPFAAGWISENLAWKLIEQGFEEYEKQKIS